MMLIVADRSKKLLNKLMIRSKI